MAVDRLVPTVAGAELVELVREIAQAELAPRAAVDEAASRFPRDVFTLLGRAGVLGMPYPEEYGGAGQPYEVYLQALEEIATAWLSVGVGVSVHVMSLCPLQIFGTEGQRQALLPPLIAGDKLGAYALSEPQAGSDISGMTTRAKVTDEGYELSGTKAWITHGSVADFYSTFARTSDHDRGGAGGSSPPESTPRGGAQGSSHHESAQLRGGAGAPQESTQRRGGITCFLVPGHAPGMSFGAPEHKMGMTASTTTAIYFDQVPVAEERRIGPVGEGMRIALSALDSGRLGIAACATGLAQAALDWATTWAKDRAQFGRTISSFQGLQFMLADMAAAVDSARASYLYAARRRDAGKPFTRDAAVAKLVATDAAMKVTTDAVQVLGGYGYSTDFPVERYLREAKVTQIFEGTNQIQRLVISRQLLRAPDRDVPPPPPS